MEFFSNTLRAVFPDQCLSCGVVVDGAQALCGSCWRDTEFISGAVCDACGAPLMGGNGAHDHCDDCLATPRPWSRGRAVLRYEGAGRRLVLAMKHGDRTDLCKPAAGWMHACSRGIATEETVLVPVPVHRLRLPRRRYNQAAALAHHFAKTADLEVWPDALRRVRATRVQDGMSSEERFANLDDAIMVAPLWRQRMPGAQVLLVDDVMTSGATLDACARACLAAGATQVSIVVLARVVKET